MSQKVTSAQGSAGQHEKFTTDVRIMLQCDGKREGVAGGQESKICAVNTQTTDCFGRY
jgi:hypothetical protein